MTTYFPRQHFAKNPTTQWITTPPGSKTANQIQAINNKSTETLIKLGTLPTFILCRWNIFPSTELKLTGTSSEQL